METESNSSNPDLFEDVCDEMCEQILGYLPFKDKIKLEGVSKQWKRCMFRQQTAIKLNKDEPNDEHRDTLNKLLKPINVYDFARGFANSSHYKEIKKQEFDCVLKKCSNIRNVQLRCYVDDNDLKIISEKLELLETFECEMFGITEKGLLEFGLICGQKLKTLKLGHSRENTEFIRKFLRFCPNIINITTEDMSQFIIEDKSFLPKLKIIRNIHIQSEDKDIELLRIISKKYCNTMKNISICAEEFGRRALPYIQMFVNLQYLFLSLDGFEQNDDNQQYISYYLEKLSENCRELKFFTFFVNEYDNWLPLNLFEAFSKFYSISNLVIGIRETEKLFECKCDLFKSCAQLKHLVLYYDNITDDFFENIGQHIPNLRSIYIDTEKLLSDHAMTSMAKLKKLRKLAIIQYRQSNKLITDIGVCQLINSCTDIENIWFTSRPKISNATIDYLIAIALQRNRKSINFRCGLSSSRDELQFEQQIDINRLNNLPHNLKINIRID